MTTKSEFEAVVSAFCSPSMLATPRIETDGAHKYECFDANDGTEIGFITWRDGNPDYCLIRANVPLSTYPEDHMALRALAILVERTCDDENAVKLADWVRAIIDDENLIPDAVSRAELHAPK